MNMYYNNVNYDEKQKERMFICYYSEDSINIIINYVCMYKKLLIFCCSIVTIILQIKSNNNFILNTFN